MFTYIASHNLGATRFDSGSLGELVFDMSQAHELDAPTPQETSKIALWATEAKPGDLIQCRTGWVFRRSDTPAAEVVL